MISSASSTIMKNMDPYEYLLTFYNDARGGSPVNGFTFFTFACGRKKVISGMECTGISVALTNLPTRYHSMRWGDDGSQTESIRESKSAAYLGGVPFTRVDYANYDLGAVSSFVSDCIEKSSANGVFAFLKQVQYEDAPEPMKYALLR